MVSASHLLVIFRIVSTEKRMAEEVFVVVLVAKFDEVVEVQLSQERRVVFVAEVLGQYGLAQLFGRPHQEGVVGGGPGNDIPVDRVVEYLYEFGYEEGPSLSAGNC